MQTPTSQKITLENLDKFSYLDKNSVKLFVRNKLQPLSSYSVNEETILISLATGLTLSQLILFNGFNKQLLKKIKRYLTLRLNGMPLNKIAKSSFFYSSKFYINNNVLAPRKETEILVEKVIEYAKPLSTQNLLILDLCCGSGVIGLTLAKHIKNAQVILTDVSPKALSVTRRNAKQLKLQDDVLIKKSDMFQGLKNSYKFDIIVTNPPYIKTSEINLLDEGVKNYDPTLALDGGEDGLVFYKQIASNAKNYLTPNGIIFLEIGYDQATSVTALFEQNNFETKVYKDYSNLDRIVVAKLK